MTSSRQPTSDEIAQIRARLAGLSHEEKVQLAARMKPAVEKRGKRKEKLHAPATDDELHASIIKETGFDIPRVAVCEDHCAPFDPIADGFFNRQSGILILKSREAGGTLNVSILQYMRCKFIPQHEGVTFGAIRDQAEKAFSYVKGFVQETTIHDDGSVTRQNKPELDGDPLQKRIVWRIGSLLSIIVGTQCLPRHAKVITPDGPRKMHELVDNQEIGPVKSFNFVTNEWEWRPIVGWYRNGPADQGWVRVKLEIGSRGSSDLTCTPNHEVLSLDGVKKPIGSFRPGEWIAVRGEEFSGDQQQVLMGSLLGDGHISSGNASQGGRGGHRYRVTHGQHQFYYLDWMADAFSEFNPTFFRREAKSTKDVDFSCARTFHEARLEWYPEGQKRIPDRVWEELTPLGLAVWLMDDGSIAKATAGRPGGRGQATAIVWTVNALIFNEHERQMAQRYFDDLGVEGHWYCIDRDHDDWAWRATNEGSLTLQSIVEPYIDISEKQPRGWKRWKADQIAEHSHDGLRAAQIREIAPASMAGKNNERYDIQVEHNHNFLLATGVLVGNSGVNSPHPNTVHADEVDLMDQSIIDEAANMSSSSTLPDGTRIPALDVVTSTRKSMRGPMQKLIQETEEAEAAGFEGSWKLYAYCVAEIAAETPCCRRAPADQRKARLTELGQDPDELCTCDRVVKGEWGEDTPRTLESVCQGRFFKSRGWMPQEDIRRKFRKNSQAVWESQMECRRPMADGLYLPTWTRERYTVVGWTPRPEFGNIWLGVDWGGTADSAILWVQGPLRTPVTIQGTNGTVTIPRDAYVVFDEHLEANIGATKLADKVVLKEMGWRRQIPNFRVTARFPDMAGKQQRDDWREHDPPLRTVWYLPDRRLDPMIGTLQGVVEDNRYWVDSHCSRHMDDIESWRQKDGKEVHDDSSHSMAATRYLIANTEAIQRKKQHTQPADNVQPVAVHRGQPAGPGVAVTGGDSFRGERNWRSQLGGPVPSNSARGW